MTWFLDNLPEIRTLALRHLWLSLVPVVLGFLIAVPIGWYANRHPRLRGTLLTLGGILYTVPSLALLLILPSIIGTSILDANNVVITLTLYAVALLVRTASDAFGQLSGAVLDAASATGYGRWRRALQVELPLAGPVLLAGVRVVSVSTVSLVTVGALIGVSNLGSLFTDGFQRNFTTEIVIGVIAVVVLALLLDAVWVLLGAVLLPWASQTRARRAS